MEVIDNFLPLNTFHEIRQLVTSSSFLWNMSKVIPTGNDWGGKQIYGSLSCDPLKNYQLNHTFYKDDVPVSPMYNNIYPLLQKLQPRSIMRVRANCTINTETIVEHGMHKDYDFDSWAAVYYLNTCNGYTKFENGEKVDSVANRVVKFKANELHTGTTCTDTLARYVINVNFF